MSRFWSFHIIPSTRDSYAAIAGTEEDEIPSDDQGSQELRPRAHPGDIEPVEFDAQTVQICMRRLPTLGKTRL
eukprot:scaffold8478_cov129-Ochromonas_danica.AAC.2